MATDNKRKIIIEDGLLIGTRPYKINNNREINQIEECPDLGVLKSQLLHPYSLKSKQIEKWRVPISFI